MIHNRMCRTHPNNEKINLTSIIKYVLSLSYLITKNNKNENNTLIIIITVNKKAAATKNKTIRKSTRKLNKEETKKQNLQILIE